MGEQRKVLFIVYKTEWWGCFDAYCRQECAREDTLCYVMPVPRYEREEITLKANFGKVHFEPEKLAALLPDGAHMADHRDFPLEQDFERIYIHNPYENGSPMDTVDLKYYACQLKPYAEKLIYVPHLLGLPYADNAKFKAYDYVDAIYVPNEDAKYALNTKYDRKAEIVPSGIPAYLNRLGEKMRMSEAPQGTAASASKMKLLYCVSYDDISVGMEKQLAKMRDVFEYVRKNPNILLIFRPDEDIQARRMELSPSIWEGYCRLLTYFCDNRIGIYDQTPDLYEVAAMADGILYSVHPMVGFFSVQGKHVLYVDRVQRPVPTKEDRCIPVLWALTAEEKDGQIEALFVPEKTKLICRMTFPGGEVPNQNGGHRLNDRKKGKRHLSGPKVEILAEVPDEIIGGLNYINITKAGNCLYLSPFASDGIWKCDLETGSFHKQYLPGAEASSISMTFAYGRFLYMVPRLYPGIVKYDTETEEITVLDGWVDALEARASQECRKEPYFVWAAKQEGHMLYMASSKCDVWMELDMDDDTWSVKPMGLPGRRFLHMVKDGEWVWLLPFCGDEIILWNCRTGESRLACHTVRNEARNSPYSFGVDMGEKIVAFPQQKTDHLLVMEKPERRVLEASGGQDSRAEGVHESGQGAREEAPQDAADGGPAPAGIKTQEVRKGIPCGFDANLTEYQRQRNSGYQFVKKLGGGLILAYEYYDGCFLVFNQKLQMVCKVPCRLPIEAVRQQEDLMWKNAQIRNGFSGGLSEGNNLPAMMEYFVRHGRENREEIRRFHERYYPRVKM